MKTFYVALSESPRWPNANNLNRFRFVFMAMIFAVVFPAILCAQAPAPAYSGPQNYVINNAITSLYPSNSGGAVAAPGYSSSKSTVFSGTSYVVFDRDAAGNLYAFDYSNTSNKKLVKLSSTGSLLATYLTFLSRPEDIEVDAAGNIFALDASTLYKITPGGTVSTLSSTLFNANGLALDAADNVYVAEYNTSLSSVIEVPADGSSTINIGSGLSYMTDVAVDAAGNVYVCNDGDASIKKIPAGGGSAVTIASGFTSFNTSDLSNIIVDGLGDIFFTERNGSKVSEIPAGTTTPVSISSGFFSPSGLALDLAGNLYISDGGSVYKVAQTGGYFISPALPAGLSMSPTTGVISGTPTVLSAATNYTITASNSSGSTSTVVSIAVLVSSPTDANLSSLTVGTGTLTPSFSPTTYSYTVEIPNSSIYETLTTTTDNNLEQLSTPGGALSSGFTTTAGPLAVGLNTVYFNVLAQDGVTKNVYSVGITRDASTSTTINSIAATSTYSNASAIQFTATFAASITGLSASNFSLSTTGAVSGASVASVSGSGTTYTITVNTGTGDGTIGLNLSNATGLTPGISTSLPFTGGTTTIDKTPPVITISAPSSLFINSNSDVTYTVTFSDTNPNPTSIGSVNLPAIVFANKIITGNVTIDEISASGSNPRQLLILAHGDGTLAFNLPAGIVTDLAGNANAATTLTTACTIDDTAPTVTIGNPSVSSIAAGAGSVTYAITYADANFASSSLVLANIHLNTTGNATGTIGLTGSATSYTVTISNITGSGTIGIKIAAGTATDAAGNTALASTSGTFTVTPALATVNSIAPSGASPTNATTASFTVTFGAAVTGLTAANFSLLTTGTVSGAMVGTPTSTDNITWTVPVNTGTGDGDITLQLANAGNLSPGISTSLPFGTSAVTIDKTAPTVVSFVRADPNPSNETGLDYQITFSEPVTGVTASDFTTVLSGVTAGSIGVSQLSSTVYNLTVGDVAGDGTVQVKLKAGVGVTDLAGNATVTDFNSEVFNIEQTPPSVKSIIATSPANTSPTNSATLTYTATFSVPVSGVSNDDFTLTTTSGSVSYSSLTVTPVSGSVYTVEIDGVNGNGTVRLDLNGSSTGIFDLAGNAISGGFTSGNTYVIDQTAPARGAASFLSNNTNAKYAKVGDIVTLTLSFNEKIQTPVVTIGGKAVTPTNPSSNEWQASYTLTSADTEGQIGFDIIATDLAGNSTEVTSSTVNDFITFDKTPPTVVSISKTDGSPTYNTFIDYQVTFSEPVTGLTANAFTPVTSGVNASNVTINAVSSTVYDITINTVSGNGTVRLDLNSSGTGIADLAGNPISGGFTGDTYTIDQLAPALTGLTLSNGTLSPGFNSTVTAYTAAVGNGLANIEITPTVNDPNATVTVNGTAATSGSPTAVPLVVGVNTIPIVVTALDGSTQKTYTITITEVLSGNDNLASVKTSAGLAQGTTVASTLTENVVNSVTSLTVIPTVADPTATVTVNNITATSGKPSASIPLNVGTNTVTIVVTAQNTKTKTYTLTVTRAPSANTNLSNLVMSKGTLAPAFGTPTNYLAYVANGVQLTVTPTTADPNATLTINGTSAPSGAATAVPIIVGNNTITIVVTAQDKVGTKTYTVVVNEARSPNNTLFSFKTSGGLAKGQTVPTTLTENVPNAESSITVTPTVVDANATVTVNNAKVISGQASASIPLNVGDNTITTIVTAQNGTTLTYTLTVTRAGIPTTDNTVDQPVSVDKPIAEVQMTDDGVNVHQGVSPNGDGINDFLQIDNISLYPDNNLKIMNRNGQLVYETKGYDNATKTFDGHSNKNGQMQLPGTYFYALDYAVGGIIKHKTGYIVIKY